MTKPGEMGADLVQSPGLRPSLHQGTPVRKADVLKLGDGGRSARRRGLPHPDLASGGPERRVDGLLEPSDTRADYGEIFFARGATLEGFGHRGGRVASLGEQQDDA